MADDSDALDRRGRDRVGLARVPEKAPTSMSQYTISTTGPARGGAVTASTHARQLLRVEGVTYTIAELAAAVGRTPAEIRRRAVKLLRRRDPATLDDYRVSGRRTDAPRPRTD